MFQAAPTVKKRQDSNTARHRGSLKAPSPRFRQPENKKLYKTAMYFKHEHCLT